MSARSIVRWVKIEGSGDVTSGRCWRFSSSAYAGDSDSVYTPVLPEEAWSPIAGTWDPRASGSSRASVGGVTVRLVATQTVLTRLFALASPRRLGTLEATITAAGTSIQIRQSASTNYEGTAVALGREVIRLDTRTGTSGSVHTYDCTRGVYETTASAHTASPLFDTSIFPAATLPHKLLRVVTVGYSPVTGSGYGDEVVVGRGVLRSLELGGDAGEILSLGADAALDLVRTRTLGGDLWRARQDYRSELAEGEAVWQVRYSSDDPDQTPAGADSPGSLLVRVGECLALCAWSVYAAPDEDVLARVSVGDADTTGPGSLALTFSGASDVQEIWQVFSAHPSAPDLTSSGTATKARLSDHPVKLARQLLTTTRAAIARNPGANGDYDLGVEQLGCAVPVALLDETTWDLWCDTLQPPVRSFYLGLDGTGVEALSTIQTLLQIAGLTMTPDAQGLLTLVTLKSAVASVDFTLSGELQPAVSAQRARLQDPLDEVVAKWGLSASGVRERTYLDPAVSERQVGQGSQASADLSYVSDPDDVLSWAVREIRVWRAPLCEIDCSVLLTSTSEGLGVGDTCAVTSLAVVASDGTRGVASLLCQALAATPDFDRAQVDLTLLTVGHLHSGQARRIGPSAIVAALPGVGVVTVGATFSASLASGQSDDLFGFAVGDVVQFTTRDGATVHGTATITALTPATPSFTVNAVPAGAGVGSLVEPAVYDSASAAQRAAWAYLADASDTLGAGNAAAHEWTV